MKQIRLDKYLADAGLGSRSDVKLLIKKGRVTINEEVIKNPDTKITVNENGSAVSNIEVDGNATSRENFVYYMLNKPTGVISATKDDDDDTVISLIKENTRRDIFPVGRLDKDTVGLLLITNDGALSQKLLSPKKHVDKKYKVTVDGIVTPEMILQIKDGVDIGDETPTLPAEYEISSTDENSTTGIITIREGRYHQIKRMFSALGLNVIYLERLSMGSLMLDTNLKRGEYRKLTNEELTRLKEK